MHVGVNIGSTVGMAIIVSVLNVFCFALIEAKFQARENHNYALMLEIVY